MPLASCFPGIAAGVGRAQCATARGPISSEVTLYEV